MAKIQKPRQDSKERPKVNDNFKKWKGKSKGKPYLNKKQSKELLKEKRARLIVKNLPFKVTKENIQEHFGQYGDIKSIDILKKPDGKLVGCAFIQFTLVQFAKKAKHYTDKQTFLGRNLCVDFAKAKEKYIIEKNYVQSNVKDIIKDEIKEENLDNVEIKHENDYSEPKSDDSIDMEDQLDNIESKDETSSQLSENLIKSSFHSHDISEGKTVFIKNVPFQATNKDVQQCFSQFGPIYYALVCMDKLTEHSKGTAFVKFVNKEDAEKALNAGTELTLLGNILDCHPAIDKNELKSKERIQKEQKTKPKDSRNLYLVKEGVILAGTKAAEGVSASDMAKRLQIEQYKTQMLRNLNTFVSRDRLVVHNLPATWDDKKLKILLQKHGGNRAVVKEARIMRDMRKLNSDGVGESKQFGFVAFTTHEHALTALRSLNNNPNIFSEQKRPIITFSIENKSALKAKVKRQEKSRLKNPKSKDFDSTLLKKDESDLNKVQVGDDVKSYAGITSKEGTIQKMRSRYKLGQQAKIHMETLRKEKKKQKMSKKTLNERKKEFIKQPKQKVNKKSTKDNFSKIVDEYKKKLVGGLNTSKKKWYNE